jgi:hypothetical protein
VSLRGRETTTPRAAKHVLRQETMHEREASRKGPMETILYFVLFVVAYLALQWVILPKLGVPT